MQLKFSEELDQQLFIELLMIFMGVSIANIIGNIIIQYHFAINYKWFLAILVTSGALQDCLRGRRIEFWKTLMFSTATFVLVPAAFFVFGGLNILLIPYILSTSVVIAFLTHGRQRRFMITSLYIVSIGLLSLQVMEQSFLNFDIVSLVRPEEVLRDMPLQLFIIMTLCTYITVRFTNVWRTEHATLKNYSQQLIEKNEQLEWMASHDELTQVYNRRYLIKAFDHLKNLSNCYLLLLDIDDFKHVNDSYGHKTGDWLLTESAELFTRIAGDNGIVCRLGGDEFVILFYETNDEDLNKRLIEIQQQFKTIMTDYDFHPSLSGGFTKVDATASLSDNLIKSDQLLYKAKKNGKQQIERLKIITS